MLLLRQQRVVEDLAARAGARAAEAARIRRIFSGWTHSYFGSVAGLSWTFAMGAWWAAGRQGPARVAGAGRKLVNAVNTAWLGWQLVHRQASRLSTLGGAAKD